MISRNLEYHHGRWSIQDGEKLPDKPAWMKPRFLFVLKRNGSEAVRYCRMTDDQADNLNDLNNELGIDLQWVKL